MTNEEYKKYADRHAPRSPLLKDMLFAFLIGGFICCLGQLAGDLYRNLCGLDKEAAASATSITLVFLGALLTGLGVYDDIAKLAGAGTLVPITGFANSAKIFIIPGPVIVYGISSSVIYGLLLVLFGG